MPPDKRYVITFDTGIEEEVYASSQKTAIILAQAEQIKRGNRWENITGIVVHG